MTTPAEAYAKLKPPKPTPPTEVCKCANAPAIKLMTALSYNPMHCVACDLEVTPESLKLSAELAEAVAEWNAPADGIHRLWIARGEYEQWAGRQLSDLQSPINVDGRRLAEELSAVRRCYYWAFTDDGSGLSECPGCGGEVSAMASAKTPQALCEDCSLIGPAV
jgi:predicted  nucleic acid-binding Zn ribbon protein